MVPFPMFDVVCMDSLVIKTHGIEVRNQETNSCTAQKKTRIATTVSYLHVGTVLQFSSRLHN